MNIDFFKTSCVNHWGQSQKFSKFFISIFSIKKIISKLSMQHAVIHTAVNEKHLDYRCLQGQCHACIAIRVHLHKYAYKHIYSNAAWMDEYVCASS